MRIVGRVINITREGMVTVKSSEEVSMGGSIYTGKGELVGKVVRVFGSVKVHYLSIKPVMVRSKLIPLLNGDLYKR
jgi:rRNA processing protein Gar1